MNTEDLMSTLQPSKEAMDQILKTNKTVLNKMTSVSQEKIDENIIKKPELIKNSVLPTSIPERYRNENDGICYDKSDFFKNNLKKQQDEKQLNKYYNFLRETSDIIAEDPRYMELTTLLLSNIIEKRKKMNKPVDKKIVSVYNLLSW